eukprot:19229_1
MRQNRSCQNDSDTHQDPFESFEPWEAYTQLAILLALFIWNLYDFIEVRGEPFATDVESMYEYVCISCIIAVSYSYWMFMRFGSPKGKMWSCCLKTCAMCLFVKICVAIDQRGGKKTIIKLNIIRLKAFFTRRAATVASTEILIKSWRNITGLRALVFIVIVEVALLVNELRFVHHIKWKTLCCTFLPYLCQPGDALYEPVSLDEYDTQNDIEEIADNVYVDNEDEKGGELTSALLRKQIKLNISSEVGEVGGSRCNYCSNEY